jgi:K+-transporting ATPase ATPase A chain
MRFAFIAKHRSIWLVAWLCEVLDVSLAVKGAAPRGAGTLPTDGALFVLLLAGIIVIVGGLSFFPTLALGPIAEHFAIRSGLTY